MSMWKAIDSDAYDLGPQWRLPALSPHPRILFVGHGRSGKDACASFLHNVGPFVYPGSFSWFALPFIAEELKLPPQQAWEERHANRQFWFNYCNWLRRDDPLFLAKLALAHGNVVTGLRDRVEMDAAKASGLFDDIIWVERPGIPEDFTVKFTVDDCTDTIHNDFGLDALKAQVLEWARLKGWLQ